MMNDDKDNIFELSARAKKYAIGIGACAFIFAALALVVTNITTEPETETQTTTTRIAEVEAEITNVPDTRQYETIIVPATEVTTSSHAEEKSESEEEQRQAPTSYTLPLSTDIGTDYSRGVPVYSSVMEDWRTHDGVDFNGAYGDGVKAIANGIVKEIKEDAFMGGTVVIDHGGGVVATYCGVAVDENLTRGIMVSESEKIGEIGFIPSESDSQFPHLHLEIRVDGELQDPLEVMGYYE